MIERQQVEQLVAEQLATIRDIACQTALRSFLVEPRPEVREWDYGAEGESYPYWVVAEAPAHGVLLAYCEHGFGPEFPWGFLFTDEPQYATLGMDSQWSWYLEEAFVRSGLWSAPMDPMLHLPPEERFPQGRGAAEPGAAADDKPE